MNRAFGMRCPLFFISAVCLSAVACQPHASAPPSDLSPPPATLPCCQYTITGGVAHPGPHTLAPGDTVSTIVARVLPAGAGKPIAIVLIRQAPEGKTHQLIQLDADGQLMDEKQNWALRNGDELLFPGGPGSSATHNPTGPPARNPE